MVVSVSAHREVAVVHLTVDRADVVVDGHRIASLALPGCLCEHCPSFHTEPSSLPILAAQRVDAEALARDAEQRGWITEAERHQRLIARLDSLISKAQAG